MRKPHERLRKIRFFIHFNYVRWHHHHGTDNMFMSVTIIICVFFSHRWICICFNEASGKIRESKYFRLSVWPFILHNFIVSHSMACVWMWLLRKLKAQFHVCGFRMRESVAWKMDASVDSFVTQSQVHLFICPHHFTVCCNELQSPHINMLHA